MRVAVFSNAQHVSHHLIERALSVGYTVTTLSRHRPHTLPNHQDLSIIEGDARQPADVDKTLARADAAIAAFQGSEPALKEALENIITGMNVRDMRRIIIALDDNASRLTHAREELRPNQGFIQRLLTAYAGHRRVTTDIFSVLRASGLDWTLVRLDSTDTSMNAAGSQALRYHAAFMLETLLDADCVHKSIVQPA